MSDISEDQRLQAIFNEIEAEMPLLSDFALCYPSELANTFNLSLEQVDQLLFEYCRKHIRLDDRGFTAFDLLHDPQNSAMLTTGCAQIDSFLGGGISCHGITEVCGEAGAGKSTFVLRLLCTVQLPRAAGGLDGAAVYLCTEEYSARRLREIGAVAAAASTAARVADFGERVFVVDKAVRSVDGLLDVLERRVSTLMTRHNVRLLVIDSIGALFRGEPADAIQHSATLFRIARTLHRLSAQYNVAVVVTNQVADVMDGGPLRRLHAALGPSWEAGVATRLALRRVGGAPLALGGVVQCDELPAGEWRGDAAVRLLSVVFSSRLSTRTELPLCIDTGGLSALD